MTAQIAESVAGMAVVQAFNRERRFQAEFDELNDANRGAGDVRAADLLGLLPVDRVPRRARDGRRPLLRLAPLSHNTLRSGR